MVVESKELDHGRDVVLTLDEVADPACLWVEVMERCLAVNDKPLSNPDRDRQVSQTVAMKMADLPPTHVKEGHMRINVYVHIRPRAHLIPDLSGDRLREH